MTNTEHPKNSINNVKDFNTFIICKEKTNEVDCAILIFLSKTHKCEIPFNPKNTVTQKEMTQNLHLLASYIKKTFNKKPYEEHVILKAINWIQKKLNQFEDIEFVLQMADELRPWERLE